MEQFNAQAKELLFNCAARFFAAFLYMDAPIVYRKMPFNHVRPDHSKQNAF
jgi:hypothetical protein